MADRLLDGSTVGETPTAEPLRWVALSDASQLRDGDAAPVSRARVLTPIILGAAAVLVLVGVLGTFAASRLAEKEAVNDAAKTAAVLAEVVVQPALSDELVAGDPQAVARFDRLVRTQVLGPDSVRVKLWSADGTIIYSDKAALMGKTFALGEEEQEVFTHPATRAEVSDLDQPENAFERDQGRLLEVYRPVWTPTGQPLLFETYAPYDGVTSQAGQLWRGFAGITLSSLLALIVLMLPVVWRLLGKVREAQQQRERLLERAVEASTDERRRIAGSLHDGVVQELAGASFAVSSAADRAAKVDQPELADVLTDAAATVRRSITGMRSLMVDIYPPSLETSGLLVALEDLTSSLRSRDIDVVLDLAPETSTNLSPETVRLVYRVAHECVLNCTRHSLATLVTVSLHQDKGMTVLEISDDGVGFDPEETLANPPEGHFGLRVLADIARGAGADLYVAAAPDQGTQWVLRLPTPEQPARS